MIEFIGENKDPEDISEQMNSYRRLYEAKILTMTMNIFQDVLLRFISEDLKKTKKNEKSNAHVLGFA